MLQWQQIFASETLGGAGICAYGRNDVQTEEERWAVADKIGEHEERCGIIFGLTGRMPWKRLTSGDHSVQTRYVQQGTAMHMARDGRCALPHALVGLTHVFIMDGALVLDEDFLRTG